MIKQPMRIYISGLFSSYQVEHIARVFFPGAQLLTVYPKGRDRQNLIRAHFGMKHLWTAMRYEGRVTSIRTQLVKADRGRPDYMLAEQLYSMLRKTTKIRPPWGMMTGVRPVRLIHDARHNGQTDVEIRRLFLNHFDCTPEKFSLALEIANLQKNVVENCEERDYSIYIGVPFCPSRCSYCSFVSRSVEKEQPLVQDYIECLCREIEKIKEQSEKNLMRLKSIYIGGGTPTSLTAQQLRQLMDTVKHCFDLSKVEEYTVEAGRPDCTDKEKLRILKEYGATRISINPQTFSDEVLNRIGRKHTAQDILNCYYAARETGHENINMDLIAGLPGDSVRGFEASLRQAIALAPENITVHTLTLKRASNLVIDHKVDEYDDVELMLKKCSLLAQAGYMPYYMYRQKNTLKNLENIGWCKPGKEGLYNIYIMEEIHSILAAGAGASTKLCCEREKKIHRIFNYKYPSEYIKNFDVVLKRKEGVTDFYASNLDTQKTSGIQSG